MKLLLITALFLAKALSLPASPSSISAIFSAIPTSAVPTTSSPALFSAIPTSVVPTPSSSSITVTDVVDQNSADMLMDDNDDNDDVDDVDNSPSPNMSIPQNISATSNHTDHAPSPYHHPYQSQHNTNATPPYLNSTLKAPSNDADNDNDNNDNNTPNSQKVSTDGDTDNIDDDDDDADDNDNTDKELTSPLSMSPVGVSSKSSNTTSTADLIPDSRTAARL